MPLRALVLNCTLKKSPEKSNTDALIDKAAREFSALDVETEVVRIADLNIPPGVVTKVDDEDEWPQVIEKIRVCDIFIIATPIWVGHISSICQKAIERLDATFYDEELTDEATGQYLFYNKVGGVIVTGNEDGAHAVTSRLCWCLTEFGCTVPANASTYWVGEAGPGPSYIEAGQQSEYTNRLTLMMVHNLAAVARALKATPIPTSINDLTERAKQPLQPLTKAPKKDN
jgi:multimeric flavodoxin WrbA